MRTFSVAILLLAATAVVSARGDSGEKEPKKSEDVVRPINGAESIFAIFAEGSGRVAGEHPKLIFAAWPDGHVAWSLDPIHGGNPYRAGRVPPDQIASLFDQFEKAGLFDDDKLSRAWLGPDSQYTSIVIRTGKHQLKMRSWHEQFVEEGKLVATAKGIESLGDRRRLAVLKEQPAEYLHYRFTWDEVRLAAQRLIPHTSHPVIGALKDNAGGVTWQESGPEAE